MVEKKLAGGSNEKLLSYDEDPRTSPMTEDADKTARLEPIDSADETLHTEPVRIDSSSSKPLRISLLGSDKSRKKKKGEHMRKAEEASSDTRADSDDSAAQAAPASSEPEETTAPSLDEQRVAPTNWQEDPVAEPPAAWAVDATKPAEYADVLLDPKQRKAFEDLHKVVENIGTVVYGKRAVVELVLLAVVARGHVLIEDVPGVGKTSLVSALSKSISSRFSRIQFTPDVMPSDVTGFSLFNQKTHEFEFRAGGVMANIVLADEINRASAKTQSALLEVMEERQVTVDTETHKLEEPFMVLATQNPIEQFGTYPLPEAQVDRFMIKTSIGYPAFDQEMMIIEYGRASKAKIGPVVNRQDIVAASEAADTIYLSPQVNRYIVEIVTATRNSSELQMGASPRASIALASLSKAYALYQGRSYVIPDDVKHLAPYTLCHRISLAHSAGVEGRSAADIVNSILSSIAVPVDANGFKRAEAE